MASPASRYAGNAVLSAPQSLDSVGPADPSTGNQDSLRNSADRHALPRTPASTTSTEVRTVSASVGFNGASEVRSLLVTKSRRHR